MSADRVLISLDRSEARAVFELIDGGDWARVGNRNWMLLRDELKPRLSAALDRDPGELEAQLAELLYKQEAGRTALASLSLEPGWNRKVYRWKARAVIALLSVSPEKEPEARASSPSPARDEGEPLENFGASLLRARLRLGMSQLDVSPASTVEGRDEVTVNRADLRLAIDWRTDAAYDDYPDVRAAFERLAASLSGLPSSTPGGDQ